MCVDIALAPSNFPPCFPRRPGVPFRDLLFFTEMAIGTKNRQNQTAEICREHLRTTYSAQGTLVEDFIVEIEGNGKSKDILQWSRFTNMDRDTAAMLVRLDEKFTKWLNGDV